ncbi:unnamed protein product [Durusdinium trenchii]|uniref:Tetratricopeptide repeat protein 27 n=1 Tax=Durusdinium trenchii TaxID=1381693 RepID=A0ABP0J4G9_9DINO
MDAMTSHFLLRLEYALLSIEPTVLPKVDGLPQETKAEAESLLRLFNAARSGRVAEMWQEEQMRPMAECLTRAKADLLSVCHSFGSTPLLRHALLALAVASLQHFLRANWTGPPEEAPKRDEEAHRAILAALEVDGEAVYELLACPGYLWLAAVLLGLAGSENQVGSGATVPFWRARCAFAWQLSVADASERGSGQCPHLFQDSTSPLATGFFNRQTRASLQNAAAPLLRSYKRGARPPIEGSPQVIAEEEAAEEGDALEAMLGVFDAPEDVEVANRLCWYSRLKVWPLCSQAACEAMGFSYELTGVLGTKREHQITEFAQLVVKTQTKEKLKGIEVEELDGKAPGTLSLKAVDDLTDVLETPKLSTSLSEEERQQIERQDQPREEEAAEGPLFTVNWLTFSCGLWFRCRAEHHRNKTRERAAFQLQSLVDQFMDEKPSAAHRLRMAHSCGYPARFHLQHEVATRMMRMGMVSTAHEQFKKLRMWPEAVECLIIAERNVEAEDMLKELIEKHPSPRLWCCLGDVMKDPQHYETAWELSKKRFARAQRSLGRYYFDKKQIAKSVEAFKLALDINPMYEGIWFTLGSRWL